MRRLVLIAAGLLALCACGGSGSITASGRILGVPSDNAYTVMAAQGATQMCDVIPGAKVTITDASGKQVGWALFRVSGHIGQFVDVLTFSVSVPGGSSHYGVTVDGLSGQLSESASQLQHMNITCGGAQ